MCQVVFGTSNLALGTSLPIIKTFPCPHMSKAINDADFDSQVLKADKPVLLDFWAPWCGPCKVMLPVMEELEAQYAGKVEIMKMNVDENMDVPSKFNVMSIPTFIIFKKGEAVKSFVGTRSKEDIVKDLDEVLS